MQYLRGIRSVKCLSSSAIDIMKANFTCITNPITFYNCNYIMLHI